MCFRSTTVTGSLIAILFAGALSAGAQNHLPVRYLLLEGTTLIEWDDNGIISNTPMRGTFDLKLIDDVPILDEYAVTGFRAHSMLTDRTAVGDGSYWIGGEMPHDQRMVLDLVIDGNELVHLDSGLHMTEVSFPSIKIELTQDPAPADHGYRLEIIAVPAIPIWFSTSLGFHAGAFGGEYVSDGDVLTSFGSVLWRNEELTENLDLEPPVPDVGLDAIRPMEIDTPARAVPWWDVWFSAEIDVFSTTHGQLGHGDFLAQTGWVVERNADLLHPFQPAEIQDAGLDAIDWSLLCDCWYFSTEEPFMSHALGTTCGDGDILCAGCPGIFMRNVDLLANFQIEPPVLLDYGLDALFLFPTGHIWFSTDVGFTDARFGWIRDGDLLSTEGWVIRRNAELLRRFQPLEEIEQFGLDALHLVRLQRGDMNGDGKINNFDIDPFVLALTQPDVYYQLYPEINPNLIGDLNNDGTMNNFDIDPFVDLLVGPP